MEHYDVSVVRLKLVEDEVPSAETNSDVVGLLSPPSRMTAPDLRPQHKWNSLCSSRLTDRGSNEFPPNFSQDLSEEPPRPPQSKLLQKVAPNLMFLVFPTGNV